MCPVCISSQKQSDHIVNRTFVVIKFHMIHPIIDLITNEHFFGNKSLYCTTFQTDAGAHNIAGQHLQIAENPWE